MSSVRVLIVASNPTFLRAATLLLQQDSRVAGVLTAQTASMALGQTQTWRPDVVLIDTWLPDMSWLEATRRLKARPRAPRIILMTTDEVGAYRSAAAAVQVDDVLDKTKFAEEIRGFLGAPPEEGDYVEIIHCYL